MKELRETKMVPLTTVTFIAKDGKMFETEKECISYERKLDFDQLTKDFKKLKPVPIYFPIMENNGELEVNLIKVNSDDEFDTVLDYYSAVAGQYGDLCDLKENRPKNYPKYMLVERSECYVGIIHQSLKSLKEGLMKAYDLLPVVPDEEDIAIVQITEEAQADKK